MSDDNKIENIETTPEKANVRSDLAIQLEQAASGLNLKHIEAVTFAAEKCYFEHLINNSMKHSLILKNPITVNFNGIERDESIAIKSLRNRPENLTITNCNLSQYFKYETEARPNGTSFISETPRMKLLNINYFWADFCCHANKESIEEFTDIVSKHVKTGLAYITVSLNTRASGTRREVAKTLGYGEFYDDETDLVQFVKAIESKICSDFKKMGVKYRLIYSVTYGGGKYEKTKMLTIGFEINMPEIVKLIIENRTEDKMELRKRNFRTFKTMKKHGKWILIKQGRKQGWTKKVEKVEEVKKVKVINTKLVKAVNKYEKIWGAMSMTKKHKIAAKFGISFYSLCAYVSRRHGKFVTK